MQSTDVNRTMMSGYSELTGIYPAGEAKARELTAGEQQSMSTGRGLPKMNIRDASELNKNLAANALPNGFVSVPIYTFVDANIADDVAYSGCTYAKSEITQRRNDNANYIDYWWVANFVKEPLAEGLGVDDDVMEAADFPGVYDFSDSYVAREFENLPLAKYDTFDANTYLEMRALQKIDLTYMFSRNTRRLVFSRILRKPLEEMGLRVDRLLNRINSTSPLRYIVYSAHDDQISNMMEFLHPTNVQMDYVKFASQVTFELYYDEECISSTNASEECFSIKVYNNGELLELKECGEAN